MTSPEPAATTPVYEFDAASGRLGYAVRDLREALERPRLLWILIANDFSKRYRGALVGGLWITFTTTMTVTGLALLYAQVFDRPLAVFFPYVALGIIVFGTVSTILNEGTGAFVAGAGAFSETRLPKALFPMKIVGKAIVAFAFKMIVVLGVVVVLGLNPAPTSVVLSLIGLALVFWIGFWAAVLLGVIAARFHDLGSLVNSSIAATFFLTPIFWEPERLGPYAEWVKLNPLFHLLNITRGPLLDLPWVAESFVWAAALAVAVTIAGWTAFVLFVRRLPYWC